jgi:hypothetical protein
MSQPHQHPDYRTMNTVRSSADNTTMSLTIDVTREPCTETQAAEDFYDEVAHGSADRGDYPFIYKVTISGDGDERVFYAFKTGLPRSREPWTAGYVEFTRDTVLNARTGMKVDDSEMKELVQKAVAILGDQP